MSKIEEKGAEIRKAADEVRKLTLMIGQAEEHLKDLQDKRTRVSYELSQLWSELNEMVVGDLRV